MAGGGGGKRYTTSDRVALAFCAAAVLFLLAGGAVQIRRPVLGISCLKPLDAHQPPIQGTGFAPNAVYTSTPAPPHRGDVSFYGSWLRSDASTGSAYSRWYPAVPRFALYISGYLNTPGNRLCIEYVTASSGVKSLRIPPELAPGEAWWVREIELPQAEKPLRFVIHAIDGSSTKQGWLGFSDPFLIQNIDNLQTAKQILMIFVVTAGAFVSFLSPGLLLRQRYRTLSFLWIPLPGILILALLGLLAWFGPERIKPRWICRSGLAILLLFACYALARVPLTTFTSALERRVLAIVVLVGLLGVIKSTYSLGPAGELYAGRISRTLEPGGRADSRISFHGVQLVALRASPHGGFAHEFYYPWSYSSRGPIASLAVAPIVLSSPVQVNGFMPDAPWQLFDPQGFAAYRISMIVLASCALITVFGLAAYVLPGNWPLLAFLATVSAPFVIHEVYFTWPKLLSAAFVLIGAYLVLRSFYFWAGFVVGLGYLVHPSALLWLPALAAMAFLFGSPSTLWISARRIATLSLGTFVWILLWLLLNRGSFAQNYFLSYVTMTASTKLTLSNWLHSRMDSALNTLIPMNLFLFHRDSLETTSIYQSSSPLIRFFFQYWNTLPFGVGIGFFFGYLLRAFWLGLVKKTIYVSLIFVVPFVIFLVYWGMSSGGLTREGLHAWVIGLIFTTVLIWQLFPSNSQAFWRFCNWTLLFRGVENVLLLLLPTVFSNNMLVQKQFEISDIFCLAAMPAIVGFLAYYTFFIAEGVRKQTPLSNGDRSQSAEKFDRKPI
ncbi:MAG: hypothetical protein JOZ48_01445 [Acidobacteriaceae bacterium]|nr:hypothetical protein [Acidobacteriaceae bacterium]